MTGDLLPGLDRLSDRRNGFNPEGAVVAQGEDQCLKIIAPTEP